MIRIEFQKILTKAHGFKYRMFLLLNYPCLITYQWLAGCPVDRTHFAGPCLAGASIWPGVACLLEIFLRPQGATPQAFTPLWGLALLPGAWGAPIKENADGAEDIFGNAGRVWAMALRPDPTQKRPCAILIGWWDGWQIPLLLNWLQIGIGIQPLLLS